MLMAPNTKTWEGFGESSILTTAWPASIWATCESFSPIFSLKKADNFSSVLEGQRLASANCKTKTPAKLVKRFTIWSLMLERRIRRPTAADLQNDVQRSSQIS